MSLQQFLGKFTLSASQNNFVVGSSPVVLTVGSYFIAGYSGESTANLCEHIQACIRAQTAYSAATCSYDGATGLVTLAPGTIAAITWTDTGLQSLLGFEGSQTGANTYTATKHPRYCWVPSRAISTYPMDLNSVWEPSSSSIIYIAPDGTNHPVTGNLTNASSFGFTLLPKAEVIKAEPPTLQSYQEFWEDVIHHTNPFRYYPDRSLNTSSDFKLCAFRSKDEIGSFLSQVGRNIKTYNGLWSVSIPVVEAL